MFEKLKYFSTIFFGTFIIAVGVYFFMNPNHIISGSISGLAVVLVNFVPLSLSAMTLLLNIICIILAFLFVDKTFGTKDHLYLRPAAGASLCVRDPVPKSGFSHRKYRPGRGGNDRRDLLRTGSPL